MQVEYCAIPGPKIGTRGTQFLRGGLDLPKLWLVLDLDWP
jgi:hypothetical protein